LGDYIGKPRNAPAASRGKNLIRTKETKAEISSLYNHAN
jgi:hypothetical protein